MAAGDYVDPVREDGAAGGAMAAVPAITVAGGANPLLLGTTGSTAKKEGGHPCTVSGCGREQYVRGLCAAHYKRRLRGNPRRADVRGYERRAPTAEDIREAPAYYDPAVPVGTRLEWRRVREVVGVPVCAPEED